MALSYGHSPAMLTAHERIGPDDPASLDGFHMTTTLQIVATMVAKLATADELRATLIPAVAKFRAEPGCSAYVLLEDRKQPGRFMTYETWTDEAALAAHMKSPTMVALGPKMKELLDGEIKQDFLSVLVSL
ncbi:MAG: antibiotic biosynthesis monooxygenase [Oxalobacteraceae bacterium]|nr:MAG: antibiotic biosynthesis monooxygenase [Oxalobacteraceae bacterium]